MSTFCYKGISIAYAGMVKSVANYVVVYPPFPFPKLRVPKTEKKLKGIAEDIAERKTGTLAAVFIKGIEAIIHSGKEVDHAEYHSERIKKGVFDFLNLLFYVPFD